MEQPLPPIQNDEELTNLSNFEKWHAYCKNLVSPETFISFGFYYIVAASLQRRVWLPPSNSPLFPNIYPILVGEAGLGKGMVIKEVAKVLRFHKMENPNTIKKVAAAINGTKVDAENQSTIDDAANENFKRAEEEENSYGLDNGKGKDKKRLSIDKPLCLPLAADATTYEALVKALAKSLRFKDYPKVNEKTGNTETGIYAHSSLAFCLEEISSVFKKKQEEVAKLMLNTYDCGNYEYDTKTQGKDRVKNCCLNFFGGTTPSFVQDVFSSQLLTDGFASRSWFIFESENRDSGFFLKPWTEKQMGYWRDVVTHVGKLIHLYGEVKYADGVQEWLEDWWSKNKYIRANTSLKLESYYSRLKAHILKQALAIHFGESTEMVLGLEPIKKAIEVQTQIQKNMHLALGFGDGNPLTKACRQVVKYITVNGKSKYNTLLVEVFPLLPKGKADFEEVMSYLMTVGQVTDVKEEGKLGTTEVWYQLPSQVKHEG